MKVGILKEIKIEENRVSMTPGGVEIMRENGHTVLVQAGAGKNSGFEDPVYSEHGAEIVNTAEEIYKHCDMVMHVKEPQPSEYKLIRKGQIIFAYLHLAAEKRLTRSLMRSEAVCIAYETIQSKDGTLPLLTPMSEVAGRMSVLQGSKYLEMEHGGHGVLLGGVPGVDPGTVLILGGGTVGTNAAKTACGLGAKVYVLETNLERMRYLSDIMPRNCFILMSKPTTVRRLLSIADVVIGAVLIPGAKAPNLITREMLKVMKKGSVVVDVAIDQGGCFETSRPTTHARPIYNIDGIVHYCVANMPGALPETSTVALTNATLPYAVEIANKGWKRAMSEKEEIKLGANVIQGKITYKNVADSLGFNYTPVEQILTGDQSL